MLSLSSNFSPAVIQMFIPSATGCPSASRTVIVTTEVSAPLAKSRLGVTEIVTLPLPCCGASVIVAALTLLIEVFSTVALMLIEPDVVALNTTAATPLASVVSAVGVK